MPLTELKDKYVACLSGIARLESFEALVEQQGAHIEIRRRYPDHHWFDQAEMDAFVQRCADRAIDFIVTTEKDAVRFLKPEEMDVPLLFLRIRIEILQGRKEWDRLVDHICGLSETQPLPEWGDVL